MGTLQGFLTDYPWLLGVIFLVGGPVIGLYGQRLLKWVIAGLVCLFAACFLVVIASAMTWMDTTVGFVLCTCIAIGVGVFLGWLTIKWKIARLGMYLLGGFAGFFVGAFIFTLCLAMFQW